jgi:tetratricopeptide (TPR) repeat protein
MSIELPPEAYELADLARWERLLGRKALAAFRHGGPEVVLGLLRGRKERTPDSPLYAIEARALVALERHKAAATLLDRALKGYPAVGNAGRLAELLWIRSQVSLSSGHIEEAATTLERLAKIAQTLSSPLPFVQALTELVDVKDALKLPDASETRGDLASALSQLEEWEVDKERALVRLALARLGPAYPAALRSLLPFVIYDWTAMMGFGLIDVRPALAEVERVLRASEQPRLLRLANLIRENRGSEAAARRVAQSIIDFIGAKPQDPHEVEAVFYLLQAERASLREATLAGLESYKEPWEFAAAPEVRA